MYAVESIAKVKLHQHMVLRESFQVSSGRMLSSFTPTGSTNAQLMGVEKRSQFLGSNRVSTLGSQPPQSESNDNWTDASRFLIESQEASTKENWGDKYNPC